MKLYDRHQTLSTQASLPCLCLWRADRAFLEDLRVWGRRTTIIKLEAQPSHAFPHCQTYGISLILQLQLLQVSEA